MVALSDVLPFIAVPIDGEDIDLLLSADSGNADAQNDLALLFDEFGKQHIALHWWRMAAGQGYPDAMHYLGNCFVCGKALPRDENIGIMWIAKAASLGHVLARKQMGSLLRGINP